MGGVGSTQVYRDLKNKILENPERRAEYEQTKKEIDLAIALAGAREARYLTQAQLAEATGIKQQTISRYERGQIPELPTLRKLAAALNVRITIEPDGRTLVTPL